MKSITFVWSHSMASQNFPDEYWLSKDDSMMYSISRLANDGHDVSVVSMTERSTVQTYEREGYRIHLFPVDVQGQKFGRQTSRPMLTHLKNHPPDFLYLNALNMVMHRIIRNVLRGPRYILHPMGKMIHDTLVEDVDALVVSNENQKREAIESFYIDSDNVWINPFGADTDLFKPNPDASRSYDAVYFGRLVKGKNIETLIRAFKEIDGRLLLIGKGPYKGQLKKIANSLGIEEKVVFKGWVENRYLPDYLTTCKIFVLPSPSEGGGRSIPEAMACGLPVIVMKGALGSEAYVENNRSGCIIRPRELADTLARMISDEELLRRFGRRCRALAESEYSSEAFYKKVTALVEFLETGVPSDKRPDKAPGFLVKRLFKLNYWLAVLNRIKHMKTIRRFSS